MLPALRAKNSAVTGVNMRASIWNIYILQVSAFSFCAAYSFNYLKYRTLLLFTAGLSSVGQTALLPLRDK
jgi:hypothetical protein